MDQSAADWTLEHSATYSDVINYCPLSLEKYQTPLQLLEYHVRTNPNGVAFLHPNATFDDYLEVTYAELVEIADKVYHWLKNGPLKDVMAGSWVTVALEHTPESFLVMLGLLKADMKQLFVAQYQSFQTIDSLMTDTKSPVCVYYAAAKRQGHLDSMVQKDRMYPLPRFSLESVRQWPSSGETPFFREPRMGEAFEIVWSVHSSGTTATPHPVYMTNRRVIMDCLTGLILHSKGMEPDPGHRRLTIGPFADSMTLFNGGLFCVISGITVVHPLGSGPQTTVEDVGRSIALGKVTKMNCYPPTLIDIKAAGANPKIWNGMRSLEMLVCGGAPVPEAVAEAFEKEKISIESGYGSTETGLIMWSPGTNRMSGELEAVPLANYRFEAIPSPFQGETLFELFVPATAPHLASNVANHQLGYQTLDVFQKGHSVNRWVYWGRVNDLLNHLDGTRTNASLFERKLLASCPAVLRACVVGDSRPYPIVLVEPSKPVDKQVREDISTAVLQINLKHKYSEASLISDSRIIFLPSGRSLFTNYKGTVQRSNILVECRDLIDNFYQTS